LIALFLPQFGQSEASKITVVTLWLAPYLLLPLQISEGTFSIHTLYKTGPC